jgi:formate/nitrite transporter
MGFMAGIFIGMGGVLMCVVAGGLSTTASGGSVAIGASLPRFAGGIVFPLGLIFIGLCGADLFTSNVMYMLAALLAGKITWRSLVINWIVVYLANYAGAVVFAYFFTYLPEILDDDPYRAFIMSLTNAKFSLGWGQAVLKGIACNVLVCVALFLSTASDSFEGKIFGIWWPIMAFITVGYEHSVANMYFLSTGMMYNSNFTYGNFLAWNMIPVTIGNIIGGGFICAVWYYVYSDYCKPILAALRLCQGHMRVAATPAADGKLDELHPDAHNGGKSVSVV